MDLQAQLDDLRNVAAKLSIEIQYSTLFDNEFSIQSGYCKLGGRDLIILDTGLPDQEQVNLILQVLGKFDLEHIFVAPWIREHLENPLRGNGKTSNQPEPS